MPPHMEVKVLVVRRVQVVVGSINTALGSCPSVLCTSRARTTYPDNGLIENDA